MDSTVSIAMINSKRNFVPLCQFRWLQYFNWLLFDLLLKWMKQAISIQMKWLMSIKLDAYIERNQIKLNTYHNV